jgi:hypothetical protein
VARRRGSDVRCNEIRDEPSLNTLLQALTPPAPAAGERMCRLVGQRGCRCTRARPRTQGQRSRSALRPERRNARVGRCRQLGFREHICPCAEAPGSSACTPGPEHERVHEAFPGRRNEDTRGRPYDRPERTRSHTGAAGPGRRVLFDVDVPVLQGGTPLPRTRPPAGGHSVLRVRHQRNGRRPRRSFPRRGAVAAGSSRQHPEPG